MHTPNFSPMQFLDAAGVGGINAAFGSVTNSIQAVLSAMAATPGWVRPGNISTPAPTGLLLGITIPTTVALVTGSTSSKGLCIAHGVLNGQDTQTYTANFTTLVPGVGSATVYLLASGAKIQQDYVPIPGPPPGHPSYNPNFVPTYSYANIVDSIAVFSSGGPADNINTFEIGRFTLAAGATGISAASFQTSSRMRAGVHWNRDPYYVAGPGTIADTQASYTIVNVAATGITTTLPAAAVSSFQTIPFVNSSAYNWIIAAGVGGFSGMWGAAPDTGSVTNITVRPSGSLMLWCDGAAWWAIGGSSLYDLTERTDPITVSSSGALIAYPTPEPSYLLGAGNITSLLPFISTVRYKEFSFVNPTTGTWTLLASGTEKFRGVWGVDSGAGLASGIVIGASGTVFLFADGDTPGWWPVGGSALKGLTQPGNAFYYTTSGTYSFVAPSNVYSVFARIWGGGGAAGWSNNTSASGHGAAGGAGGYCEGTFAVVPGQAYAVVVGAGGLHLTSGAGAQGTASTFLGMTANGGNGGAVGPLPAPTPGGTATGGSFNSAGGYGDPGAYIAANMDGVAGGYWIVPAGGAPYGRTVGVGRLFPAETPAAGSNASNAGTGGQGGVGLNQQGGDGAAGLVIVQPV